MEVQTTMDSNDQQPPQKPPKGYGKHSVWFWVVVYIIGAIIVYGLIYLLFIRKGSGGGGGTPY